MPSPKGKAGKSVGVSKRVWSVWVWNVAGLGTWRAAQVLWSASVSLLCVRKRLLGGRRCGCGWVRAAGQHGPARVGAADVGGDGRTLRREGAEERPAGASAARRQRSVNSAGAEQKDGELRVLLQVAAGVQLPRGGCVRRVSVRAGTACAHIVVRGTLLCEGRGCCGLQCSARACCSRG